MKKGSTKQKKRKEGGEEDRMKNRKEKEKKKLGSSIYTKRITVLGLNPVNWYI